VGRIVKDARNVSAPTLLVYLELEQEPRVIVVADSDTDEQRLALHVDQLLTRRGTASLAACVEKWLSGLEERAA
jgi:hypothetical protein